MPGGNWISSGPRFGPNPSTAARNTLSSSEQSASFFSWVIRRQSFTANRKPSPVTSRHRETISARGK